MASLKISVFSLALPFLYHTVSAAPRLLDSRQTACGKNATGYTRPHVSAWTNQPLVDGESFGDPSIFHDQRQDRYYVFATHHKEPLVNVPMVYLDGSLPGIGQWVSQSGGQELDALPGGCGAWALQGDEAELWTPDVGFFPQMNQYVMYYSCHLAKDSFGGRAGERCIGIAKAPIPSTPKGVLKFVADDKPFFCPGGGGAIGVDQVNDPDTNKKYLVFKNPSCPEHQCIPKLNLVELDKTTGLRADPKAEPTVLTHSLENMNGEECPSLAKMCDGRWALSHTEGDPQTTYTTVYAVSVGTNIKGPYDDYHYDRVLIANDESDSTKGQPIINPGGLDFVTDDNTHFIFYGHTNLQQENGRKSLFLGTMSYVPDVTRRKVGPNE